MVAHVLQPDVPTFHRVATFTSGSHLPTMNIGVAISAARSGIGEDGPGMAAGASHILVQTQQWKAGLIVIELGQGADRLPAN